MPSNAETAATSGVPLAPPVDRAELAAELAGCERVADAGRLEVYDLHGDRAPVTMREIGRIREREYRAIGAGRNVAVDLDRYDAAPYRYRQLVVWDPAGRELVAMYRYVVARDALSTLGEGGLRTHTLFRYSERFRDRVLPRAVELGRSWVNAEAVAAVRGLHAAWFGLASIILRDRSIEYFFGNVTIPATMPPAASAHLLTMLRVTCAPGDRLTPRDVAAIRALDTDRYPAVGSTGYAPGDHRGGLWTLRARLADYDAAVPPILVSYLKRSARLWAFESARDDDFGNALETAVVIPVAALTVDTKRTFLRETR